MACTRAGQPDDFVAMIMAKPTVVDERAAAPEEAPASTVQKVGAAKGWHTGRVDR